MHKFYFIQVNNDESENFDLFVVAKSPEDAVELWREYYFQEDDDGAYWLTGKLVTPSVVGASLLMKDSSCLQVKEVTFDLSKRGVIDWGADTDIITRAYMESA